MVYLHLVSFTLLKTVGLLLIVFLNVKSEERNLNFLKKIQLPLTIQRI